MATVTIGVDLGQRHDLTAVVVVEAQEHLGRTHYYVRHHGRASTALRKRVTCSGIQPAQ